MPEKDFSLRFLRGQGTRSCFEHHFETEFFLESFLHILASFLILNNEERFLNN